MTNQLEMSSMSLFEKSLNDLKFDRDVKKFFGFPSSKYKAASSTDDDSDSSSSSSVKSSTKSSNVKVNKKVTIQTAAATPAAVAPAVQSAVAGKVGVIRGRYGRRIKQVAEAAKANSQSTPAVATSAVTPSVATPATTASTAVSSISFIGTDVAQVAGISGSGDAGSLGVVNKTGLAVQADSKVVTACSYKSGSIFNTSNLKSLAVLRYLADFSALDSSFGTNGIFSYAFVADAYTTGVAIQSNGSILVSGYVNGSTNNLFSGFVLRLTPAGVLDTTFGTQGVSFISLSSTLSTPGSPSTRFSILTGIGIQSTGAIVVAGFSGASAGPFLPEPGVNPRNIILARFTTLGQLDSGFNGTGIAEFNFNHTQYGSYSAEAGLAIGAGDVIVVGGSASDQFNTPANTDTFFARFLSNGQLDTAFGAGGSCIYPIPAGQQVSAGGAPTFDNVTDLAFDSTGRILAVGTASTPSIGIQGSAIGNTNFSVVRLTTTGALDTSFNSSGYVLVEVGPNDSAAGIELNADGSISVVGYTIESGSNFRKLSKAKVGSTGNVLSVTAGSSLLSSGDNFASALTSGIAAVTYRNNNTNYLNYGILKV